MVIMMLGLKHLQSFFALAMLGRGSLADSGLIRPSRPYLGRSGHYYYSDAWLAKPLKVFLWRCYERILSPILALFCLLGLILAIVAIVAIVICISSKSQSHSFIPILKIMENCEEMASFFGW